MTKAEFVIAVLDVGIRAGRQIQTGIDDMCSGKLSCEAERVFRESTRKQAEEDVAKLIELVDK